MKKHNFSQNAVVCNGPSNRLDETWKSFISICTELGYEVKVTDGVFSTHQIIGADSCDFMVIKDLLRNK